MEPAQRTKWFDFLRRVSDKFFFDPKLPHWHISCVVRGGKIFGIGANQAIKNSIVLKYEYLLYPKKKDPNFHSEMHSVSQYRGDLAGADVWVARLRKSGAFGLSAPCLACISYLRDRGIKRVFYSIDDRSYGTIRL